MNWASYTEAMRTYLNELLQDWLYIIQQQIHDFTWQNQKEEFGYGFVNSFSLACKIKGLENEWEDELVCNLDHRNAKQVFNAIILWRKTQSKKMMCYLNKQNFYVSYMDLGRRSKKWENDVLNGESDTNPPCEGRLHT